MKESGRAVVLLSGGIDSTTTFAMARKDNPDVFALSFNYGQKHKVELELAAYNALQIKAKKHMIIDVNMKEIARSALTADIAVPRDRILRTIPADIPATYVPARNTIFLSFALAWAEVVGADNIFIGANAIDYSGYPDCRPEFLKAFEEMANLATKASVEGTMKFRIRAPLIEMTKAEIIRRAVEMGVDLRSTWSCYDPVEGGKAPDGSRAFTPCRRCDSCLLRAKGFHDAGLDDPLLEASP